jgi:hypothetical protein
MTDYALILFSRPEQIRELIGSVKNEGMILNFFTAEIRILKCHP